MPTKAYFIGLGGCGLKTVSELQQKLCPNGVNNQDPNGDVYQFTYIDTDLKTLEPINKNKVVIRNADFVSLGALIHICHGKMHKIIPHPKNNVSMNG